MGINKNAIIRYNTLDRCFSNPGKRYSIIKLLEECNRSLTELDPKSGGIRKRQLYDDIRFMESPQGWSIPLLRVKEGRSVFFKYEDPNFSINNQPLNEMEAEQLKSAISVLGRFKGLPQFNWINELLPKLDQTFQLSNQKHEIFHFDNNEYLQGIEFLTPLFNAVLNQQTLQIDYQSFQSGELQQIIFYPYYLKEYNNRWFLFGRNKKFPNLVNLALDRIQSLKTTSISYEDSDVDWNEYFDDIIGVTKPHGIPLTKILLRAGKNLEPYIKTKPLHGSQKNVLMDANSYTFSIEVIPNFELENLILSHIPNLTVLYPPEFRDRIKAKLEESLSLYNNALPLQSYKISLNTEQRNINRS